MRLYPLVVRFRFLVYRQYPFELASAIVKPMINLGFTVLLWSIIAASSHGKIQLQTIIAYLFVATAISNLTLISNLKVGSLINKAIKSGDISYPLIRPLYAPLYYLSEQLGTVGVTIIVSLVMFLIGIVLHPPTNLIAVVLFLLYMPIALAISYSLNLLVGTIGFYFTEAQGIKNVMARVVNVFSGAIVPLTFFPGIAQTIVLSLPFGAAVFGPTQALRVTTISGREIALLAVAIFWAVALLWLSTKFWRKGVRQYEAIGI